MKWTATLIIFSVLIAAVVSQDETAASEPVKKPQLRIGVTHRPETCDRKTKAGDTLKIHYTGTLQDGTKFDSSLDRGDPFSFRLGSGQVIKGWDQGLNGMCVGEKRRLTIPSHLGYGDRGSPPTIPGGATLIFTTELIAIQ
eukprot:TRINITY_DN17394_c0_g1_i1.p1 TRINITY_DN17394_c0_g1~~TRINITY_DN17394_c0_g1_i1.p1  ORF type:complete len:141 (+),score=36.58 TRINITY_DN17394_c0_g1_i1:29-451(+)